MTVKDYMEKTYEPGNPYSRRARIKCADGFSMSVQGGTEYHYCSPREHCNYYDEVEIGFPSDKEDLIMRFAEQEETPTDTVYGYVPLEIVEAVAVKHGGVVE